MPPATADMGDPCQDYKSGGGGGSWLGSGGTGGAGGGSAAAGGGSGGGGWLGGGGGGSAAKSGGGGGGWLGGGGSGGGSAAKGGGGGSGSAGGGKKGSKGDGAPGAPKPSPGMAPPAYGDLGKKARDVFGSGYHFGLIKLDLKTKSDAGVEFTSGLTSNQESGKVFGSLQSKYKVKDYGLTFTEKWNTDNTLSTDVTVQDQLVEGLKLTLDASFAPQTGSKSGKLKTAYVNETVAVNCDMDLDLAGPIVDTSAVLKYQGWLAGYQTQFDTQKTKLTKNNFGLGFSTGDFALHTNVDNGKDFGGSIYQKVSEKLDCGISMNWSSGSSDTRFGVGAKYALDKDASLRAKVNNASQIGLGYQQKLRDGVTLTLSALIDGQNFNAGGHKVGLALELEP